MESLENESFQWSGQNHSLTGKSPFNDSPMTGIVLFCRNFLKLIYRKYLPILINNLIHQKHKLIMDL